MVGDVGEVRQGVPSLMSPVAERKENSLNAEVFEQIGIE